MFQINCFDTEGPYVQLFRIIEQWSMSIPFYINMGNSESYSEPSQISKAEPFVKIVNV